MKTVRYRRLRAGRGEGTSGRDGSDGSESRGSNRSGTGGVQESGGGVVNMQGVTQDSSVQDSPVQGPVHDPTSGRVLILNAGFEPLHVCSVRRAVALLMFGVAERVEDGAEVLRSPSTVFPVPSVIRLNRYVRGPYRQRVAFNRKNVFRRDDHRCQYCNVRAFDLTLDHVMPRSRGGPTSWSNVVACCKSCNAKKRDRTPEEAGMHLARKPKAPRFIFSSSYGVVPEIDPIWEKYLPKNRTP